MGGMPSSYSSQREVLYSRAGSCLPTLPHHDGLDCSLCKSFWHGKINGVSIYRGSFDVIIWRLEPRFVYLPKSQSEWQELCDGLERVCRFPDAVLAIDGSLIQIERPLDYEGWYCRKGYPAINVQCVVDYKRRFPSFAMRPGAENDKGVYNRSEFGNTIHQLLPPNKVILADAGYQLFAHCLTPYEIHDEMTPEEKNYNRLHSCTRIVVENAFGILKNRFRRFKAPLNQKGNLGNGWRRDRKNKTASSQAARVVRACLTMHNIFIHLADDVDIPDTIDDSEQSTDTTGAGAVNNPAGVIDGDAGLLRRDIVKVYLASLKNLN